MKTRALAAKDRRGAETFPHSIDAQRARRAPAKLFAAGLLILCSLAQADPVGTDVAPLGRAPAAQRNWPQFHGGPTHLGVNPLERSVGPSNVRSLSLAWINVGVSSQFGSVFRSSPAVVDGLAYFGDTDGNLYAFNANACGPGQCGPVWRARLVQDIYSSPAVANGVLYIGTSSVEGRLFAFNAAGCGAPVCNTPLWKSVHVSITESSPTVANGIVYVGSFGQGVYAFAADGCGGADECAPRWIGLTSGYVNNAPTVANGIVYAGDSTGLLYAFSADGCGAPTCDPLWTGTAGAAIYASTAAVSHGVVYIGSYWDGKLNAFAADGCGAATCAPLWKGNAGTYVDSSPAVAGGRVYIGSGDAQLKVFDAAGCGQATCAPLWVGMVSGSQATIESPPMIANGVVYVGENNTQVFAFKADGCGRRMCNSIWSFITQDPIVNSSPVMVNGTLYVAGSNFGITPELYVFRIPGS